MTKILGDAIHYQFKKRWCEAENEHTDRVLQDVQSRLSTNWEQSKMAESSRLSDIRVQSDNFWISER
jgi:hypothetical protein